jgi:hypothetical protein
MNDAQKADAEFQALDRAEKAEQRGDGQAWDRMPGESSKAYSAFCKYRDLAEARTMAKVATMSECSAQNIHRWARRWIWTSRVYAFDLVQQERFREQTAKDRLAHHRRQIQIGQALQSVAVSGLREWQSKIEQQLPLNLAPEQLAALFKLGDELECKGLGEEREGGQYTRIIVNIGCRTAEEEYEGRQGEGMIEDATTFETFEQEYAREYERLSDAEKAAMDSWKDPPRKSLN